MFGLNIDPNNPRGNPDPAELRELGVETVRYTFYDSSGGNQVDSGKAQFYTEKARAYREVGIESLVILTYDTYPNRPPPQGPDQDWDNYIERFAQRAEQIARLLAPYRPSFQVWNEPDHEPKGNYVPTLREAVFGRMLRRTRDTIKAVDPRLVVVAAGLAAGNPSWLTRVIQSQGGNLPADIVAFHPYGQRPDRNWPHPNWAFGYVGDLLNNYFRAGQQTPMWITEIGVKEEDVNHDREQVAEFLRRYYGAMTNRYSDKVHKVIWFCYSDGMVPPFGLVDAAGNRKPAYFAYLKTATARPRREPQPVAIPTTTPATAPGTAMAPPPPPVIASPSSSPPSPTTPTVPTQPPAEIPSAAATISISAQDLAQIFNQMQQLQNQLAQLQNQLQRLQAQPAARPEAPSGVPPVRQPALSAPPIENITQQLKHHPSKRFPTRPTNRIRRIIIHHTAISPAIGAERIANYGVDQKGWPGIKYHFFITGDGKIQQTNDLTTQTSHAGPYSSDSIGIGFAGDFTNAIPTASQINAGAQLIAWLIQQLGLSIQAVLGFKELVNTQSPGLQWNSGRNWGNQLRKRIRDQLAATA